MIPKVNGTKMVTEGHFLLPEEKVLFYGDETYVAVLQKRLESIGLGRIWQQVDEEEKGMAAFCVTLLPAGDGKGKREGAYGLQINPEQAVVTAYDGEGIANGLTTLYWKLREGGGACGCGTLEDAPICVHRGVLMDVSRHFFDVETVKSMIEQCSLRKLNRLHWHLSDDQGYRLESERFPLLNEIGSWRKEKDGSTYGGFYTKEQVRDIISYAKARGMEIIPEIDMPGHVNAILAAYPELSCSGEPLEVQEYGDRTRILCAGKDETLQFVYDLLDEVIELFPYPWFHIGGDEVLKSEWESCPACQERIHVEGLRDEEELQAWFTRKVLEHLQKRGRTGICWNETMKSGKLDARAVVQYWDEEKDAGYCTELAKGSRKCIYSFTPAFYLDYIPALVPIRRMRGLSPILRDGLLVAEENLLGMEAALWSEQIETKTRLEQMAFPRLFAVVEKAWNGLEDYEEFLKRCEMQTKMLDEDGIAHFTMEEADPRGEAQKAAIIAEWKPKLDEIRAAGTAGAEYFANIIYGLIEKKVDGIMDETLILELMAELRG